MRNGTDKKKKLAPILCAAVAIAIFLVYLLFYCTALGSVLTEGPAILVLVLAVLVLAALIVGVVLALRQRLQEIEGGEEEDAKKY